MNVFECTVPIRSIAMARWVRTASVGANSGANAPSDSAFGVAFAPGAPRLPAAARRAFTRQILHTLALEIPLFEESRGREKSGCGLQKALRFYCLIISLDIS